MTSYINVTGCLVFKKYATIKSSGKIETDTFLALNSLVCTCDTDKNAKLSKNELGTPKGKIVQKWVLGKILSSFEFNFLDKSNDGFIDVPEFNQALASLGAKTTTPPPPTGMTNF